MAAACTPTIVSVTESRVAGVIALKPEFGYVLAGGDYWTTGFTSRAEAIAAAMAEAGGKPFQTAEVANIPITYPDFAEAADDWLQNEGHLGNWLMDALTGHNADADFEGEFTDACGRVSREPIGAAGRKALGEALRRHGAPELAEKVEAGQTPDEDWGLPDQIHDAIRADRALHSEIEAAVRAWVDEHDLDLEARSLTVEAVEDHPATAGAQHQAEASNAP
ncbi:hypothetical protein D3867_36325 (plasmid) [Azospirillum argentinense]|uniref:Uncharacterized protein n=1 Tax=Azospirillum brasilense TaxID=192 RepID=A0A4D8QAD2_AZOBR|nr:hypothetical protein D3867_36325 [Azospirillum argentinense]